jgi:limonene-1,2-epoxide hydrolase
MSEAATRQVMQRYFEALGTSGLEEVVDGAVTWTVMETGRVIAGASEVRRHLDSLHAAMTDTRTSDLRIADDAAVLEGDAAAPGRPDERIPFCVVYEVRGDRVCAMRAYGSIESAVLPGG